MIPLPESPHCEIYCMILAPENWLNKNLPPSIQYGYGYEDRDSSSGFSFSVDYSYNRGENELPSPYSSVQKLLQSWLVDKSDHDLQQWDEIKSLLDSGRLKLRDEIE